MKSLKTNRKRLFEIFFLTLAISAWALGAAGVYGQSTSDASLNAVRSSDRLDKGPTGKFRVEVTATEHMRRAAVYLANRAFASAREHWQCVIDQFPSDPSVPAALFG